MIRHKTLSTAFALSLLLGTTAGASASIPPRPAASAASVPALSTVKAYFRLLPVRGSGTDSYPGTSLVYAPGVVLTESLTASVPHVHVGRQKVEAFDRQHGITWSLEGVEQLSPYVILTRERPVTGPGHQATLVAPSWLTVFTIEEGMITRIVWLPC